MPLAHNINMPTLPIVGCGRRPVSSEAAEAPGRANSTGQAIFFSLLPLQNSVVRGDVMCFILMTMIVTVCDVVCYIAMCTAMYHANATIVAR